MSDRFPDASPRRDQVSALKELLRLDSAGGGNAAAAVALRVYPDGSTVEIDENTMSVVDGEAEQGGPDPSSRNDPHTNCRERFAVPTEGDGL